MTECIGYIINGNSDIFYYLIKLTKLTKILNSTMIFHSEDLEWDERKDAFIKEQEAEMECAIPKRRLQYVLKN